MKTVLFAPEVEEDLFEPTNGEDADEPMRLPYNR